jgi:hypothetical protein
MEIMISDMSFKTMDVLPEYKEYCIQNKVTPEKFNDLFGTLVDSETKWEQMKLYIEYCDGKLNLEHLIFKYGNVTFCAKKLIAKYGAHKFTRQIRTVICDPIHNGWFLIAYWLQKAGWWLSVDILDLIYKQYQKIRMSCKRDKLI